MSQIHCHSSDAGMDFSLLYFSNTIVVVLGTLVSQSLRSWFGELGENTYNSAICTTYGLQIDTPLTLFDRGLQELG